MARVRRIGILSLCATVLAGFPGVARPLGAQQAARQTENPHSREKGIVDTDIGDDIDDAFALVLAVSSPKLDVIGVTTAWGDTDLRARLARRLLDATGHSGIPVAAGPKTHASSTFTQARWAEAEPEPPQGWPDAISFILDAIRRDPGQITLIAIAPFSNIGALVDRDPATFRKLKRIVLMGGSIHRRYGDLGYFPDRGPDPEYNIVMDVAAAQKMFASGVPLFVMPLDSTQLKLDEVMRGIVFSRGTPATDALLSLYAEWSESTGNPTPTLFDAMAVAFAIDPALCPTRPMRIAVDDRGYTRPSAGQANAGVCLHSDSDQFFRFYIPGILPGAR
ncbi:MAG TPA: nucleoside hydrolase [Acidobacteriaceae bacterium]|jgi:inosine-uridine nucleoside N-ribohydrolase|nr:nucleoside hydrolase [Acidobacteriaceae bacterium]